MLLWNLLGSKPVDVLAWESFGNDWVKDIIDQLKVANTRILKAEYGDIINLESVNFNNDVVLPGMELLLEYVFQMLIGLRMIEKV